MVLLDRERLPLVLLDPNAGVARCNRAMGSFVAGPPPAPGVDFARDWVLPQSRSSFANAWNAALRGERNQTPVAIRSTTHAVIPVFDFIPLLLGEQLQFVMLVVVDTIAQELALPVSPVLGLHYEISVDESGLPARLRRVMSRDQYHQVDGRPCFRVLFGRSTPCPTCPVREASGQAVTLESTRPFVAWLMAARQNPDETVSVSAVPIGEATWRGLTASRVSALAQEAKLTEREVAVLDKLLGGGTLKDIAQDLGITPRTAKYHQQNLLRKLGAESRADLLRLFS